MEEVEEGPLRNLEYLEEMIQNLALEGWKSPRGG